MLFPEKTLHDLEWSRLLEHLAERCTGPAAAEASLRLPFLEAEEAWNRLALVAELMGCIRKGDPPPALPADSVSQWLALVRGEGSIPAEGLLAIAADVRLFVSLARYLDARRDVCPGNAALVVPREGAQALLPLARLVSEIEGSFEPDGTLSDSASPELGPLRRRAASLRSSILARLEKMAEAEQDLLQDRSVTMRGDRYVLPVRADAHRRLPGIVHGASGSGATVFLEPEEMVSFGNDLMLAREEIIREEARILRELAQAVRDLLPEVTRAFESLVETEVRIASARMAVDLDAALPTRAGAGVVELAAARHPLLVLSQVRVVPSLIAVAQGECLVVSGPNAGGKTVVLKTVGLCALMLAAGLPAPLDPASCMGVPASVLTDIGDEQSLVKNLSTFSAHMTNIAAILESAGPGVIVLLDELSAGTDPTEGAALAEAILEDLGARGATTMCTTHFDALKARAQDGRGFVNAAVGFDVEALRPTFELRRGTPGSSSALAIACRFGLPSGLVDRARTLLPDGVRDLSRVVESLEQERRKAAFERTALAEERRTIAALAERHKEELARLKARQDRIIEEEAAALWASIRAAREKVRDAEARLRRRGADASVVRDVRKAVNQVAEEIDSRRPQSGAKGEAGWERVPDAGDLAVGTTVHVIPLRARGIVDTAPKGGRLFVRVGGARARVGVDEVRLPSEPARAARSTPARRPAQVADRVSADERPIRTSDNTLDLRGMTSDEAVAATDAFLDNALREGTGYVFVLHGFGTGALLKAVRAYLGSSAYVGTWRAGEREEGGDGISVAWLR
jgi:DNA mismatch repair protein MutS2